MKTTAQTSGLLLLVGVLGIVLLLIGTLIYAVLESGTKYQPEVISQSAHDEIAE